VAPGDRHRRVVDIDRQRRVVEASWALVEHDLQGLGHAMFLEIFRIAPEALKLFSFKDGENIADSPALQTHGVLVMTTVGEAVAGLKDMPSLVPILKELARRHSNFDVLPEHFPIVGRALMTTLETGLGDAWTPEVAMAWNVVWETIEGIMVPALLELRFFEEVKGDKDTKEDEESRADVEASKVESKGTKGEDEDPESKVAKGTEDDGAKGEEDESHRLVRESWIHVADDVEVYGLHFFLKIFEMEPKLLNLFSFRYLSPPLYHTSIVHRTADSEGILSSP